MIPWYVAYNAGIFASAASVLAYVLLFRHLHHTPRAVSFLLGALGVSATAFVLETYLFALFNAFIALVVIAPLVEEALKFLAVRRGMDFRAALGVGMGFAFAENALYFGSFLSTMTVPMTFIILYFLMRGASDPLLHSYTTALSVRTWGTRKLRWVGGAIALHAGYNVLAIIGGSSLNTLVPMFGITAVILLVLLVWRARHLGAPRLRVAKQAPPAPPRRAISEPVVRKAEGPNADLLLANLRDTSKLTQDQFLNSMQISLKTAGFAAVAGALGLKPGYERTKWLRHSTYATAKGQTQYWEFGIPGLLAITIAVVLVVSLLIEMVG